MMHLSKNRNTRDFIAVCLVFEVLFGSTQAMAAVPNWTAATGDWFTAGNWSTPTIPATGDITSINNGGTAQIFSGAAATDFLTIGNNAGNTGTVTVQNTGSTLTADIIFVGINDLTAAGTLNILDSAAVSSENFSIGLNQGTGTLNIASGGVLNVTNEILVGNNAASTATFNIGTGGAAGVVNAPSLTSAGGANGTVNFNHTDTNYYFTNDGTSGGTAVLLEGSLLVNHTGSGTTILNGVNTYTGATTISGGTLLVNGSNANSATTVNAGGTLGGTGTLGSVSVNGGTFAPGNSIGTTTVTGNVDFTGGGNYNVEVDSAGNSDLINATGTATLTSGIVNVQPQSGTYALSTDYTILTAGGGLGGTTFDSVNSNLAFLIPSLSYDANNVYLTLTRNSTNFASVASTPNQAAVATVMDGNPSGVSDILNNLLSLTETGAKLAFDSLSGVQHTGVQSMVQRQNSQFKSVLANRFEGTAKNAVTTFNPLEGPLLAYNGNNWPAMASAVASVPFGAETQPEHGWWIQGYGQSGDIKDTAKATGSDYKLLGIALGIDTELNTDLIIGAALGLGNSDVEAIGYDADLRTYQLASYAQWQRSAYYLNGIISAAYHDTDASRQITVGATASTATSDYTAVSFSTDVEGGQKIKLNKKTTVLTPFIGLDYSHLRRDSFTETGAGTSNLTVDKQSQDSLRTKLGAEIDHTFETKKGWQLKPSMSVAYVHEHMDNVSRMIAGFINTPGATFAIEGPELDRDRVALNIGTMLELDKQSQFQFSYDAEIADSDKHHALSATFRYSW